MSGIRKLKRNGGTLKASEKRTAVSGEIGKLTYYKKLRIRCGIFKGFTSWVKY